MRSAQRIVIVTGLSGSGKSTVLNAFEDMGYFTIDNLPILFLEKFLELSDVTLHKIQKLAIGMDTRDEEFINRYQEVLPNLCKGSERRVEILFLEANKPTLIRRFSETRRKHPLVKSGSVQKGIELEQEKLAALRDLSVGVIDTTKLNVHDLKAIIVDRYSKEEEEKDLKVHIISFGFRYGVPPEADMVMDVRFLPNPHFIDDLREKTGLEKEVQDFIFTQSVSGEFLSKTLDYLAFLLPLYEKEGKYYFHLAVGCTGGRHRSVAIAEKLKESLSRDFPVTITHNDINR
jgi:RNase adapter protein RapZ